ncbi:MAG: DUF998 domain-containing protein [Thermoplasmata archaeon]
MSGLSPAAPPAAPPRWMFQLVAALVVLYVVLDLIAQLLPPHYNAISQAESDLAVGPYGYVMTINFVNRGVLSLLFVYAFVGTVAAEGVGGARYRTGVALVAVWGVGALLLAAFPTDVPATPISGHGAIHLVVALIAFVAGAVGITVLARHFAESKTLRPWGGWALPLAALSLLLCVGTVGLEFVAPHLSGRIGGLTERLFLGVVLLWIFLVSVALSRAPRAAANPG